ncbi:MAG: hypothetical protein H7Y17_09975 [Chlorobia bacterium]|nr:hypothetical protein [Fimbriimonadaceae bacterium]
MKRIMLAVVFASLAVASFGQEVKPTISINAKGDDVRSVIHDLFKQANKNFVLNPGVRFVLYLSLDKVPFDDALSIVCKNANLKFEVQKDIYYISVSPPKPVIEPKPIIEEKKVEVKPIAKIEPSKPKGTLPTTVLAKKVTTRLQKREIKDVIALLAQQTGITIQLADDVPAFKLDAFLINTSLKFALDEITRATKLRYRFTDQLSIAIEKQP